MGREGPLAVLYPLARRPQTNSDKQLSLHSLVIRASGCRFDCIGTYTCSTNAAACLLRSLIHIYGLHYLHALSATPRLLVLPLLLLVVHPRSRICFEISSYPRKSAPSRLSTRRICIYLSLFA